MARSLKIRKPHSSEIRQIEQLLTQDLHPQQQRRAHAILLHGEGLSGVDIAAALHVHPLTIYQDLHVFAQVGLAALQRPRLGGAAKELSEAQERQLWYLGAQSPLELGLPCARWSLRTLRDYLLKEHIVCHISREHLRRVLKKGAFACCASNAKSAAAIRNASPFSADCAVFGGICRKMACSCSLMSNRSWLKLTVVVVTQRQSV